MIYKGKYTAKVALELQSSLKEKVCPHCKKSLHKMIEIKFDPAKQQIQSSPNKETVCCVKTGNAIANTISRIYLQNK